MSKLKNARFLVYWNQGFVKITLKPGQSLSCSNGGNCEEGYHYEYLTLTYDGDIYKQTCVESQDCDGRISREREVSCPIDKLEGFTNYYGTKSPDWQEVKYSQRDYSAEVMGY